jgi:hypothetical protein
LTATLVGRLAVEASGGGLLIVTSPSGVGKTSLLHAGLLPALAAGALPIEGSADWPRIVMRPGGRPLLELATQVSTAAGVSAAGVPDSLARHPASLRDALEQVLRYQARTEKPSSKNQAPVVTEPERRVVLVVDQLEELFSHGCPGPERTAFVEALIAAYASAPGNGTTDPDSGKSAQAATALAVVVLGVRADFYPQCARIPALAPFLQAHQVLVEPMTQAGLREIITGPAVAADLEVQDGLVEILLRDAAEESLPLLAHALQRTFEHRSGRTLTVAGYQQTGGIAQAVATTAESVHESLSDNGRSVLRQLLLRMVAVGDGVHDTRRRVPQDDLLSPFGPQRQVAKYVLRRLVDHRMITAELGT